MIIILKIYREVIIIANSLELFSRFLTFSSNNFSSYFLGMLHYTILWNAERNTKGGIKRAKNVPTHVTPSKSLRHIPMKNGEGSFLRKITVRPKNVYRAACNHQTEGSANGKYYTT